MRRPVRRVVDLLPDAVLASRPMRSLALRTLCSPAPRDRAPARPFALLSNARSGTNMFTSALDSHGEVAAHFEVFNPIGPFTGRHGPGASRWGINLRDQDPVDFYERFVARSYEAPIDVVIFKLFLLQVQHPRFASAISEILDDPNMRFLHLRRPNKLAVLLSLQRAVGSGAWTSREAAREPTSAGPVKLEPDLCDWEFLRLNYIDAEIGALAGDRATLSFTYGELSHEFADTMGRVQDFLEINRAPTEPSHTRQRRGTLRDNIENFDELAERYAGTDFAPYFDPDWPEQ